MGGASSVFLLLDRATPATCIQVMLTLLIHGNVYFLQNLYTSKLLQSMSCPPIESGAINLQNKQFIIIPNYGNNNYQR